MGTANEIAKRVTYAKPGSDWCLSSLLALLYHSMYMHGIDREWVEGTSTDHN